MKKIQGGGKSPKREQKQKKKTVMRYYEPDSSMHKYMNVQLKCEPFVFGSTVVLNIFIEGSGPSSDFFMVCTNFPSCTLWHC